MDINRKTAYNTLLEMEKNKAYSNLELNNQINNFKPDSPAFVRELVYGVIENRIYLDHVLCQLIPKGLKGVKKQTLVLLRMGLEQIIFMDSVPEYAAVNETVKLARRLTPGRDGFINGVLRGYISKKDTITLPDYNKNPVEHYSVKYSFEPWIVKLWIDQYGEEKAEELLAASNSKPRLCIRVNLLKVTVSEMKKILVKRGFEVFDGKYSQRVLFVRGSGIFDIPEYKLGFFSAQDESSVVAAETLAPKQGETVFDMCAAPGGKSMAMAEIMGNKGTIVAFDVYENKINLISEDAQRLDLSIVEPRENDGTILNNELIGKADKVLVDGPCSGLGVIRRKPEIKFKKIEDDGRELADKQLKILEISSQYVKKGGFILYSTCTVNKIENTDVVSRFMSKHKNEFELIRSRQLLQGIDETDGFYICKLRKRNN